MNPELAFLISCANHAFCGAPREGANWLHRSSEAWTIAPDLSLTCE